MVDLIRGTEFGSSIAVFITTDIMNTAPMQNLVQKPWIPLATKPASIIATISAANTVPATFPEPPKIEVPPMKTAAITVKR